MTVLWLLNNHFTHDCYNRYNSQSGEHKIKYVLSESEKLLLDDKENNDKRFEKHLVNKYFKGHVCCLGDLIITNIWNILYKPYIWRSQRAGLLE